MGVAVARTFRSLGHHLLPNLRLLVLLKPADFEVQTPEFSSIKQTAPEGLNS
jgi:hypothetical protein